METFDKIDHKATGTKSSAAPTKLFFVKDYCTSTETKKSEHFHKVVAKILFATKRDRLDTGTAISYLTMRGKEPDEEY